MENTEEIVLDFDCAPNFIIDDSGRPKDISLSVREAFQIGIDKMFDEYGISWIGKKSLKMKFMIPYEILNVKIQ